MTKENGKRRTVWLPKELDQKVEEIRKQLGLGRSPFYRFAIIEIVKQFAQNKQTTKEGES
jgi:metal-responsive CopG/Arc/MetJ family transcriptional regulator